MPNSFKIATGSGDSKDYLGNSRNSGLLPLRAEVNLPSVRNWRLAAITRAGSSSSITEASTNYGKV